MSDLFNTLFLKKQPVIISGPCSAETEEQVLETAQRLQNTGKVHIYRSGLWKPRTRPGMFEGVGKIGLEWLKRVKKEIGLPVTVEVATDEHVNLSIEAGIDFLWIGARSTSNPFSIQEIAEVLKGIKIPVLIKNPTSPDVDLWSGAVERIRQAGIEQIALIHRGFSTYGNSLYRNPPMWPVAIEMKRRFPEIPMLCDPSHICGNRKFLMSVCQQSIDLDYHGLMIESHINPDDAWSDAQQQITPEVFSDMLDNLHWRSSNQQLLDGMEALKNLRREIDLTDENIISLLGKRMQFAEEIGRVKKEHAITILQTERYNHILDRALELSKSLGLSEDFIRSYFETVHWESIYHQDKIMNHRDE